MDAIKFVPGTLDGSVKKGFLIEFPDFSLTLLITDKGVFAEMLKEGERRTFEGRMEKEDVSKAVTEVMERINEVMRIYRK